MVCDLMSRDLAEGAHLLRRGIWGQQNEVVAEENGPAFSIAPPICGEAIRSSFG